MEVPGAAGAVVIGCSAAYPAFMRRSRAGRSPDATPG